MSLKKLFNRSSLFTIGFLLPVLSFIEVSGQGNLLITPKRLVFEGNKRSFDLNLANIGKDSAIYAISIVQMRMKEDGNVEEITQPDPGQRFADRYIRYFPRTVNLGPGESQVVKVQMVRVNELQPGEYRSHFYFRAVPKPVPAGEKEKTDTTAISIKLTPIFGIAIPVIIRVGESDMKVSLTNLSLEDKGDQGIFLKMSINRTGNMSVYGDFAVDYIYPDGKSVRVGLANGVAVYTPNPRRFFQIPLNRIVGIDYRSGRLKVTYSAPSDLKPERFAEAELQLH